jgi:hypothetical protein
MNLGEKSCVGMKVTANGVTQEGLQWRNLLLVMNAEVVLQFNETGRPDYGLREFTQSVRQKYGGGRDVFSAIQNHQNIATCITTNAPKSVTK